MFDVERGRFTRFDLVAIGTRWGGTTHNARGRDLDPAPVGYAFTLAGDDEVVAPAFMASYGWD